MGIWRCLVLCGSGTRVSVEVMAEGWDEDGLRAVRGALHGPDGTALLAALRHGPVNEVLQLAGDGVAGAAALGLPGAVRMAATFLGALRERGFGGDEELADLLGVSVGHAVTPVPRPLAVDLEMLAMLLEGDPAESGGGSICPLENAGLSSPMSWRPGSRRQRLPTDGCLCRLWGLGTATGTWSCSSKGSMTPSLPIGCGPLCVAEAPSGGSRMSSPVTSSPGAGFTGSARSDSSVEPAPGWPKRAIVRDFRTAPSDRAATPTAHEACREPLAHTSCAGLWAAR